MAVLVEPEVATGGVPTEHGHEEGGGSRVRFCVDFDDGRLSAAVFGEGDIGGGGVVNDGVLVTGVGAVHHTLHGCAELFDGVVAVGEFTKESVAGVLVTECDVVGDGVDVVDLTGEGHAVGLELDGAFAAAEFCFEAHISEEASEG